MIEIKQTARIEEHSKERAVSFYADGKGPEETAWDLLRNWAAANLTDFSARRTIGCAPLGHHPTREGHQPNEEAGAHPYTAQLLLFEDEWADTLFFGAGVCGAPAGLFLVGDVFLDVFQDDGTIDIGSSMEKSFGFMSEWLKEMGGYEFDLKDRPYFEEPVFSNDWLNGAGELSGFKLWLPIKITALIGDI